MALIFLETHIKAAWGHLLLLELICVTLSTQVSILRFGESRVHFFQGASILS